VTASRAITALAILAIAAFQYFVLPGHTYLYSDTQIYVPVFEHLYDSSILAKDLIVSGAHLSYTIYDEIALGLKAATGLDFEWVLTAQQLLFRILGLWGVYAIARAARLSQWPALSVAAVAGLGTLIAGPAVLTVEYEPVPRGFAIGLLLFAMGLASRGAWWGAGVAMAFATLYHAPAVWPFWLAALVVARRRELFIPLGAAILLLMLFSELQAGIQEPQNLFAILSPEHAELQKLRASYNWISLWWSRYLWMYVAAAGVCVGGVLFLGRDLPLRGFFALMPVIGLATIPASYVLLEKVGWALLPQLQPMRALLFTSLLAIVMAAIAAWRDRGARRFVWAAAALYPAFLQPLPKPIEGPGLNDLVQWASASTAKDAVFLFPDEGRALPPGIFRARARRAVFVDWKAGGQVNYFPAYSREWWRRWQTAMAPTFGPTRVTELAALGIDYLVLGKTPMPDMAPEAEFGGYRVYRIR
jgi:hypothetical protein